MKNSFRLKTDLKSTILTEQHSDFEEFELQEGIKEVLKYMNKDELYQGIFVKALQKLALQPLDLIPISRSEVEATSKQQIKQLYKQDVDYYLDNKFAKLEARRAGLIAQAAREYQLIEKSYALETAFAPFKSDNQVTKRRRVGRYTEIGDEQRILRNQERRIKVLKRLKLQEMSQKDLRKQAQKQLARKLSAAHSRREKYKAQIQSLRNSQLKDPEAFRRKMQTLHKVQMEKSVQINNRIMSKLDRATRSRQSKRRQTQLSLHSKNQLICERIKSFKEASVLSEQKQVKQLKKELSKDLETHIKKKEQIKNIYIRNIHTRRSIQDKKIQQIKVELQKKEEKRHQISLHVMNEKQQQVEQNKQQIRQRFEQIIKERQRARNLRVQDIYRRKSMADLESQKKRNVLLRYRHDTENMVSQRKKSMQIQKRRGHINQQIKIEISTLNIKRHFKMEQYKKQQTKEHINLVDRKHRQMEQKKNKLHDNRQKLKIILQKRKQNLDFYFDNRAKNCMSLTASRNNELWPTQTPEGRSIDIRQIEKTKEFRNLS